ncbi:SAV_2336 N-terminal domain-related protein [Streptomyces sp. NPDC054794]
MIDELLAALIQSGADAGPEELADILWLATHISAEKTQRSAREPQQQDQTKQLSAAPASPAEDAPEPSAVERHYSGTSQKGQTTDDSKTLRGEGVLLRRPMALDNPLGVMRSLRPLGRRTVPDSPQAELDEELSATNSAENGIVLPILKPQRGRWLDLALVIDTHHSMLLWHDLVTELCRTITQTGLFRDVRVWYLSGTEAGGTPAVARASHGNPRRPQEVADPSGHRLILVITDTVAGGWSASNLDAMLRQWTKHNPLAVLNVLPRRLWSRGAVAPSGLVVRAARPAAPNVSWRLARPAPRGGRDRRRSRSRDHERLADSIAIPVTEASPAGLSTLASLVAGEGRWNRLTCLTISRTRTDTEQPAAAIHHAPPTLNALQVLRRFQESASPVAQELAGYLSAVPLTLPVMTLVRRAMLPHSEHGHIAELALSGIFKPWQATQHGRDMTRFEFEFIPGLREALLGAQLRHEVTAVQELVRQQVAHYFKRLAHTPGGDFPATRTTAGGTGGQRISPGEIPFAETVRPGQNVIAETDPLKLGVHPAIPGGEGAEQVPAYVEQEHDASLRYFLHRGAAGESIFVVLVGDEGSGKTRSAWEAVRTLPDTWTLWAPTTTEELNGGIRLVRPRTVVWLDGLERFDGIDVAAFDGLQSPVVVVATARTSFWRSPLASAPLKRRATFVHVPNRVLKSERQRVPINPQLTRSSLRPERQLFTFSVPGGATAMAGFSARDGSPCLVTYCHADGMARMWNATTGLPVRDPFGLRMRGIVAIATVPRRTALPYIAAINFKGEVRFWDSSSGEPTRKRYTIGQNEVLSVTEYSDKGAPPMLATTGYRGKIQLWNAEDGRPTGGTYWTGEFPGRGLTTLVSSTGTTFLATADYSGIVRLWELLQPPRQGELLAIRPPQVLAMAGLDRPGRSSLLATIGYDDVIRVWDPFDSFKAPSSDRTSGYDLWTDAGLWSYKEIAAYIRVQPDTVRSYRKHGLLPPPDQVESGKPYWYADTVRAWVASRTQHKAD